MNIKVSELRQIIKEEVSAAALEQEIRNADWQYEHGDFGAFEKGKKFQDKLKRLASTPAGRASLEQILAKGLPPEADAGVKYVLAVTKVR